MTHWDFFFFLNDCGDDFNRLSDTLTTHILFCEETVTSTILTIIHPNDKKWIFKGMKACLAFLQGDKIRVRELQKEFRRTARSAKIKYKDTVEKKLISGNAREAWQGLNIMMGRTSKPAVVHCSDRASLAEQLLHPLQQ